MAMRAKHGMMQGVPLEPLLLLTQEEVAGHEAACAVQAITRGRAERGSAGGVLKQKRRAEAAVRASSLDWTIVRPGARRSEAP